MASFLEGIRIVETATVFAGPMSSRLLADWGADVIHIEHPVRGDTLRSINSSSARSAWRASKTIVSGINYEAENHNHNKRGITLDLSLEEGQKILYRLLEKADVFLSNYRERELKKFRLEYETLKALNPGLIYANISGYGRKGPDRDLPGYDFLAFWARSGLMHAMLTPKMSPLITPVAVGDRMVALGMALGIMAALYARQQNGLGQEVDVSLFQMGVFAAASDIGGTLVTGQDIQQVDREDMLNALATFYQTKDGQWLRLGMGQPELYWSKFCQAIGRPDLEHDPRFVTHEPRIEHHVELYEILDALFRRRALEEWRVRLNDAALPWAPVQTLPEVVRDPQARANDLFSSHNHPTFGRIELIANPVKLGREPVVDRRPAPEFGQHTEEILLDAGYSWEEITRFKEKGIIA